MAVGVDCKLDGDDLVVVGRLDARALMLDKEDDRCC